MNKVSCLELFSGAGGLAKGLELAGARHVALVERNHDACETLRLNFPCDIVYEGDAREFPFERCGRVDLIAGGPPCQPFSLGGKSMGNRDGRDMFPYAVRSIRNLMPKAFMFENVKGLLRNAFRRYFNYIILQLTYPDITYDGQDWEEHLSILERLDSGRPRSLCRYRVSYKLVNAADYGIPQRRERVIIVGIRNDVHGNWIFPEPTHSEDALLWDKYVSGGYWERHGLEMPGCDLSSEIRDRLVSKYGLFGPQLKPWRTVRDALSDLPMPETGAGDSEHCLRLGAKEYEGHTGSEIDMPSKTIKAGAHGVPGGENMVKFTDGVLRYYTVLEAKRIQTFPDDYRIHGSWTEAMRQLGNAVPVQLAYLISNSLVEAVSEPRAARRSIKMLDESQVAARAV